MQFREGTMFAKELTLVGDTAATSGIGFFNGDLQGFEIAHKDSNRYSEETDGWAYYTFGHVPVASYADSTAATPTAACAAVGVVAALLIGEAVADDSKKYEATFTADGEMVRPAGWREWVFVGSPLTPNSLNGGTASRLRFTLGTSAR